MATVEIDWAALQHKEGELPWAAIERAIEAVAAEPERWGDFALEMRDWQRDEESRNYVGLYVPVILGEAAVRLGEDPPRREIVRFLLDTFGEAEDDNEDFIADACAYACERQGASIVPVAIERIETGDRRADWLWRFLRRARGHAELEERVKEMGKRAVEETLEGKREVEDLWPALQCLTDVPNPAAEETLQRLGKERAAELESSSLWPDFQAALAAARGDRSNEPPAAPWKIELREFLDEELETWKEAYEDSAEMEEGGQGDEEEVDRSEEAEERTEELSKRFGESEEARGLSEAARDEAVDQARIAITYGMNYLGGGVETWGIDEWREVLLEILPRKISAEPEWFATLGEVCAALLRWLAREGLSPQAEKLAQEVAEWGPQSEAAAANPENWGLAKSLIMGAGRAGIDLSDPENIDDFLRQDNERITRQMESDDEQEEEPFGGYQRQEPIVRQTPKIGRNDPCPCGSGKKYKKCCGK
ncbi:MAG TPA: SEC-C metal-binding domain-containing protein [Phycisphaerae bacterium]|nr:SEC-C metal-binding domain-containing protein [Phycisphaerae bacterium]